MLRPARVLPPSPLFFNPPRPFPSPLAHKPRQSAKDVVGDALFETESEEMVLVKDIDVHSLCEHHLLPFFGKLHVAYLPAGRVVGLSKLARIADVFCKRLQIQERLTLQIAQAVEEVCGARGVAVTIECTHMCMSMRGVQRPGAVTVTSAYLGALQGAERKAEFAAKIKG